MAPWPEQGTQPKAPDKSEKKDLDNIPFKQELEDSSDTNKSEQVLSTQGEDREVLTLDEGQLKALLDEAITYKNPKDREGKSELFKELLQEAEENESDNKGLGNSLTGKQPRNYYNLPGKRRHSRHQSKECGVGVSTTRGGSLQNLHALGMEGGSRSNRNRRSGRSGEPLVSARQREGGSLPSNVNVDNDTELDSIISRHNYTSRATLEVSASTTATATANVDDPINLFQNHSCANGNEQTAATQGPTFNSVRSVLGLGHTAQDESSDNGPKYANSICVGAVESGAMLYTPSPIQHVSVLSIPPSQLPPVNSDENQKTDKSDCKKLIPWNQQYQQIVASQRPVPEPAPSQIAENFLDLETLRAHFNRYSSFMLLDNLEPSIRVASFGRDPVEHKKAVDENGNAVPCVRSDTNSTERKKTRRVKTKNDQNFILAEQIEGFRGGADIDTLMEYIESPTIMDGAKTKTKASQPNGPRNHVKVRAKEDESRPTRRRGKEKMQRCNSLEEISKTKLEDLTEESSTERVNGTSQNGRKKQGTLDDAQLGKKSWSGENRLHEATAAATSKKTKDRGSPDVTQDAEFHVVAKRQRKKKRRPGCGGRMMINKPQYYNGRGFPAHDRDGSSGLLYQYQYRHGRRGQSGSQPRRKSASSVPPSDKSDSSDLDSVHSLPVTSSSRTKIGKNSVSGDSTPRASYADIARTMASPPAIGIQGKASPSLPDLGVLSSDHDMLPATPVPAVFKKDAMTDTNCDTLKSPPLLIEEYPPLEVKPANPLAESVVKVARGVLRDNNNAEDKVSLKTVTNNYVISGNVPHPKPKPNVTRPPVILMNEPMVNSHLPTEFTFGFEVNQQLLQCEESMCDPNNVLTPSQVAATPLLPPPTPSLPTVVRDPAMKRLIQFLNDGWDNAMRDLRSGKATYYQGQ